MSNARDHEARTAEIGDTDAFTEDVIAKARITAAQHSANAQELTQFLHMLGIHPDQAHDSTYVTRHAPLPASANSQVSHPLNPRLADNYPHCPPRILRVPPDRNFGTQFRPLPDPKGDT